MSVGPRLQIALVTWLLACSGAPDRVDSAGDADSADIDTNDTDDTAPIDTAAAFCDGVPTLAYTNFGEGFLRESCQGCHASTAPERFGAPEAVTFDTVDDAWTWAARILARSTGDAPTMPPQGGVSADDRTRLAWWLRCGTPGT
ncbi:MAG: hypothetical protein V4850_35895 [Myxococcota bacterium]